jgi:arginase
MAPLSVIGVPSSAGSYAAGQDRAPAALRAAGLMAALARQGIDAVDHGDLPEQVWAPDPDARRSQNESQVVESVHDLAERVAAELQAGRRVLVIGGNCTIATGVMAAATRTSHERPGLVYLDRHFDMNTPDSTDDGALDWMGLGHAFDLPGALQSYTAALGQRPLLTAAQVAFLGVDPTRATDFERYHVGALAVPVVTQSELISDPGEAGARALTGLPPGPLLVHVDVDVLDFVDAPLAENTDGRTGGPTLAQLWTALRVLLADPRWRVLSIGEINPTRAAGVPELLPKVAEDIADVLTAHEELTR